VVNRALREVPAHRQSGVACPDDDRRRATRRRTTKPEAIVHLTSTVTLVGFVMMSYTAERFCDWATNALTSSGEASASIL